jgi:Zn-finger nucleic acid-binding protein
MKRNNLSSTSLERRDNSEKEEQPQVNETIEHDDLCPICHLLLLRPVKTKCNHSMCEECLNLWTEISITQQMTIVGLDDDEVTLHPSQLEISCPMCRTVSTGTRDLEREEALQASYPQTYQKREAEEQAAAEDDDAESVETLTVYVGNKHQRIKWGEANRHSWTFFIRTSRTELIEEVQIFLVCISIKEAHASNRMPYRVLTGQTASNLPEPSASGTASTFSDS